MTSKVFIALLIGLSVLLPPRAELSAKEATLSDLKPGQRFEVLENLSVTVPGFLRMLSEIPPLVVTANSIGLVTPPGTSEPVCLVSGLALGPELPAELKLPKGATIDVKSVDLRKKRHPLFSGLSVAFSVQAPGTHLKAKLRCFPGKGSESVMAVEELEKIFRRKIRLLAE